MSSVLRSLNCIDVSLVSHQRGRLSNRSPSSYRGDDCRHSSIHRDVFARRQEFRQSLLCSTKLEAIWGLFFEEKLRKISELRRRRGAPRRGPVKETTAAAHRRFRRQ